MRTDLDLPAEQVEWECVFEAKAGVGECPIWCPDDGALYWIDIPAGTLHRTHAESGETVTWQFQERIGSFALIDGEPAALVALHSGLYHFDLGTEDLTRLHDAPYDPDVFRFNDGRTDKRGRFWVGNMPLNPSDNSTHGKSAFWRLEQDKLAEGVSGTTIANGIAFSCAGDTMYMADDASQSLLAFDYDLNTGAATNRRVFSEVPKGVVLDGAAVDTDDNYWIALPFQETIAKFMPDGTLDRLVKAPTRRPSMVCFGGHDMDYMYLVTMRRNYPNDSALAADPLAGAIFRCRVGASGLPEPKFRR